MILHKEAEYMKKNGGQERTDRSKGYIRWTLIGWGPIRGFTRLDGHFISCSGVLLSWSVLGGPLQKHPKTPELTGVLFLASFEQIGRTWMSLKNMAAISWKILVQKQTTASAAAAVCVCNGVFTSLFCKILFFLHYLCVLASCMLIVPDGICQYWW